MNCFSSCFLLKETQMGRPWGQYFRSSRRMTSLATARSSCLSLTHPALMAALQATVCSSSSRTVSLLSRLPARRSAARFSTASAASSGLKSMGICRRSTVLSPNSSTAKPSSSNISALARSSPVAAGLKRTGMGDSRLWALIFSGWAFSFSKRMRSWAACLSMRNASSPCSTII